MFALEHSADGVFCLLHRQRERVCLIGRQLEGVGQEGLELGQGVGSQHVDGDTTALGIRDGRGRLR